MAKLDALYALVAQTLAVVQTGGGVQAGGGVPPGMEIDVTPRTAPPKPVDEKGRQVADAREMMLAELRERLAKRKEHFDQKPIADGEVAG